jgi:Fe2+ or Zn2+ uptake regulation protein
MPSPDEIQLERHQREESRWYLLRILYMARPYSLTETTVLKSLQGADLPITPNVLRQELDYLAAKGLVDIVTKKGGVWRAKLAAYGIDVVEYAKDAPAGIARPDEA